MAYSQKKNVLKQLIRMFHVIILFPDRSTITDLPFLRFLNPYYQEKSATQVIF